jgi:hypothetical protein
MGTPNKELVRAKFLLTYRNAAMEAIQREHDVIATEAIGKLCYTNQNLLQCKTPSFIFEGKWYAPYALPRPTEMKDWNRILHPSLLEEVKNTLTNIDFEQRVETAEIDNFLASVMIEAIHVQDVARLIPGGFASCLPMLDPDVFNLSNVPLSNEQIEIIKAKNGKGLACLNEIAIRNLLLQKV